MLNEIMRTHVAAIDDAKEAFKKAQERLVQYAAEKLLHKVVRYRRLNNEIEGKVVGVIADDKLYCKLHIGKRTANGFHTNAHAVGIKDVLAVFEK